jgi:nucleotide-binding universal stress UspA family protein
MTAESVGLIVCATDFSPEAASALSWAAAFARREGARIDLVHVLPEPTRDLEQLATDAATFEAARREDATAKLTAEAVATVRAAGVTVQPHVLTGEAEVRIVEHAARHAARMIVMGACGRPRVERWVLGSVAERTVRSAACPVVIIPRVEPDHAWFPAESGGTARPLKALVGLEGGEGAELIGFTADLRRRGPCDVTFLHLYWPIEEYARLGLRGPRDPIEVDPDVVKHVEPRLRALIDGLPGHGGVTLKIRPALGAPGANLAAAAEEQPYDLLVVGSHQRHGLARVLKGSVSADLSHQAVRTPIACVPGPARDGAAARGASRLRPILTVLAPTDLSEIGNAAIPHAYALLRATGGVVELCFVHEHGIPNSAFAYDLPERLTAAERATIERQLRELVPPDAGALGITTHVSVIDGGKPAETIVTTAERLNVDAIALGSHGRGGLARAVLGSVAEYVVRRARRPVLVIPQR